MAFFYFFYLCFEGNILCAYKYVLDMAFNYKYKFNKQV